VKKYFKKSVKAFFETDRCVLIEDDSLQALQNIKTGSIDLIFADPPYFLSDGGITNKSGKMSSVNKGTWDTSKSIQERDKFNNLWIRLVKRVLKDDGTIWISGTYHNIYSVACALERNGFEILNNITWEKLNPPPNIATRRFTHSTETILWARKIVKKNKYYFNYDLMKEINGGKQMKDVWRSSIVKPSEKAMGNHPTQKPLWLLERIILASSKQGDVVLDPFSGSGTTGVAAISNGRQYIGIELDDNYNSYAIKRLQEASNRLDLFT
jgi:site-specific DNA-methyltransferase (adenine-specific)